MARFANKTTKLKTILLTDGSGVFLRRGESCELDYIDILRIPDGVVVLSDERSPPSFETTRTKKKAKQQNTNEKDGLGFMDEHDNVPIGGVLTEISK